MVDGLTLPAPCVVVLVGPGASGKSTWAAQAFAPTEVVSSDALRAVVGAAEDDVTASADAFDLLEQVVAARIGRRLTTVIDTLGLDRDRRTRWLALARDAGLPVVAVAFDTPAAQCRERNRGRTKRLPNDVLSAQLKQWPAVREALADEGFDQVVLLDAPRAVRMVAAPFAGAAAAVQRQVERPTGLRFGLHLGDFTHPGGPAVTAAWLRGVATTAERVGFDALYVMDHFRQIPQVGRAWDDMLESWTTLAYLSACTSRVRLGTLVTGVTHRNIAHLAKIVATLDVLSEGRAVCGVGLGWFAQENDAYGIRLPPVGERYAVLEDALQLLPLMWGPGSPRFDGVTTTVTEALCYPRPLQEHVPVMVGGGGERRTLRLAARYGDAANVMGDADRLRHKVAVLRAHCVDVGRDPADVEMTHLSNVLVGRDDDEVATMVESRRPRRRSAAWYAASANAGTVADHVGRFRELAEAGAAEVMVRLTDLGDGSDAAIERMGEVIRAFR